VLSITSPLLSNNNKFEVTFAWGNSEVADIFPLVMMFIVVDDRPETVCGSGRIAPVVAGAPVLRGNRFCPVLACTSTEKTGTGSLAHERLTVTQLEQETNALNDIVDACRVVVAMASSARIMNLLIMLLLRKV
jgi:hypothetical protein